jgi:4-oxalocrotonate tautomerase family enzyme
MATVVANTTIPLKGGEVEKLIDNLGTAVTTALGLPPTMRGITFNIVPSEFSTKRENPGIDFFVYTAPGKTVDQKRALVKAIQATVDSHFKEKPQVRTVVIIKEHSDENVGVGGVLRADTKKQI